MESILAKTTDGSAFCNVSNVPIPCSNNDMLISSKSKKIILCNIFYLKNLKNI